MHALGHHAERGQRATVQHRQHRPVRHGAHVERLVAPAVEAARRQRPRDRLQRGRPGQRDPRRARLDLREAGQRLRQCRPHPAHRIGADMERQPLARQHGVLAGADVPQKPVRAVLIRHPARLSNRPPACHMRSMRPSPIAAPPDLARSPRSIWQTIASLLPYLWPRGDLTARARVVVAMACLVAAKVATVYVPVIYGRAVDALAPKAGTAARGAAGRADRRLRAGPRRLRPASASCATRCSPRCSSAPPGNWRCAPSSTCTRCRCASTSTARPARCRGSIDRGAQAVQSVLRLAVFNIIPTLLELAMVTAILWAMFDWRFAVVTFARGVGVSRLHASASAPIACACAAR